jgi:hypothetical protein
LRRGGTILKKINSLLKIGLRSLSRRLFGLAIITVKFSQERLPAVGEYFHPASLNFISSAAVF